MKPRNFPARVLLRRYRAAERLHVGGYVPHAQRNPDTWSRQGRSGHQAEVDRLARNLSDLHRAIAVRCARFAGLDRIEVTAEAFDRMIEQIESPAAPTPAMRALFEGNLHRPHGHRGGVRLESCRGSRRR